MLDSLSNKLAKLKEFSDSFTSYETIRLGSIELKISSLNALEIGFLDKWVSEKIKLGGTYISWVRLALAVLSIKAIDDLVLPDEPTGLVDTGERDEAGVPLRKPRFQLIYDTIRTIDPDIIESIAQKFSKTVQEVRQSLEHSIEFENIEKPPSTEEEIKTPKRTLIRRTGDAIEREEQFQNPIDEAANALSEEYPEANPQGILDSESLDSNS